jgi:hypothetical protein
MVLFARLDGKADLAARWQIDKMQALYLRKRRWVRGKLVPESLEEDWFAFDFDLDAVGAIANEPMKLKPRRQTIDVGTEPDALHYTFNFYPTPLNHDPTPLG